MSTTDVVEVEVEVDFTKVVDVVVEVYLFDDDDGDVVAVSSSNSTSSSSSLVRFLDRPCNPKVPDRSKTRSVPSLNPPQRKFPEGDKRNDVPVRKNG